MPIAASVGKTKCSDESSIAVFLSSKRDDIISASQQLIPPNMAMTCASMSLRYVLEWLFKNFLLGVICLQKTSKETVSNRYLTRASYRPSDTLLRSNGASNVPEFCIFFKYTFFHPHRIENNTELIMYLFVLCHIVIIIILNLLRLF